MTKPRHAWMVRAGNNNELADLVEEKHAVAIGWPEMGDVSDLESREQFKGRYRESYLDQS
jgi:restriction system protein